MNKLLACLCRVVPAATLFCSPAYAQQLYLRCHGVLSSSAKPTPANLELILRGDDLTARIQHSDVLPVGVSLKYVATEQAYTMQMRTPAYGTSGDYSAWFSGPIFVWHPDLKNLALTRLSVDRQTGVLDGEILNIAGRGLGRLRMNCRPRS